MQISVDVVIDLVCPWCFIGKRNLEAAIRHVQTLHPEVRIVCRWLPFLLNPDTPAEGAPYRAFLEAKFGGPEAVERIQARVSEAGQTAGIDFAFADITVRPSSIGGHRLIQRLQALEVAPELVDQVVEQLFAAHFLHGENIGDPEVLLRIAAACGPVDASLETFVASAMGEDAVRAMAAEAEAVGITGVPCYIVDQRHALVGAQPPAALAEALVDHINR